MEVRKIKTPVNEQETVIQWCRDDSRATIYTSDSTMMTRYDKNLYSGDWVLENIDYCEGDIVAKTYSAPKELMFGRKKKIKVSEERKKRQLKILEKARDSKDS